MAYLRYRAIVKVLCDECQLKVVGRKRLDINCRSCSYKKYRNVNNLISFTNFLHIKFPNWIWLNIYEYRKGENGPLLKSFQKGKNEPVHKSIK